MEVSKQAKELEVLQIREWDESKQTWGPWKEQSKIQVVMAPSDENVLFQYGMDGKFIRGYQSQKEAQLMFTPESPKGAISNCLAGQCRTAYGFMWLRDKFTEIEPYAESGNYRRTKVYQHDIQGNFIKEYGSIFEAQKAFNQNSSSINACISRNSNRAHGFSWFRQKENGIQVDVNSEAKIYKYVNGEYVGELGTYAEVVEFFEIKNKDIMYALKGLKKFRGCTLSYEKNQ